MPAQSKYEENLLVIWYEKSQFKDKTDFWQTRLDLKECMSSNFNKLECIQDGPSEVRCQQLITNPFFLQTCYFLLRLDVIPIRRVDRIPSNIYLLLVQLHFVAPAVIIKIARKLKYRHRVIMAEPVTAHMQMQHSYMSVLLQQRHDLAHVFP